MVAGDEGARIFVLTGLGGCWYLIKSFLEIRYIDHLGIALCLVCTTLFIENKKPTVTQAVT